MPKSAPKEDDGLQALAAAVRLGKGRPTLFFAAFEPRSQRRGFVRRLRAALAGENVAELSLRDPRLDVRDQTSAFFGKLRALADEDAGDAGVDVVLLTDWDRLLVPAALRDEQATTTLTGLFNRGRESFKAAFPMPVVVLLTQDALAVVEERAPDFASWKSGIFELAADEDDDEPPDDGSPPGERRDPWEVFRGAAVLEDEIFGRETDLKVLLERIVPEGFRCGAVWGETGTGKSSLLRAGLLPRLERIGHLPVIVDRWEDAVAALRRALTEARVLDPGAAAERREKKRKVVLLCDQFERVFDAIPTQDRRASFFEELARPVNDLELPFCCVFAVRADRLYHLFELDRWVPLHRPLAVENLYHLRHLRESDAVRVFEGLRTSSGAAWTDELLDHIVEELADDGRVRPVEIQLIAAGLYLRGVRTVDGYAAEGRKEGLLKGYLDGVLDELDRPELGRRVVRSLVVSASPAVRTVKSPGDIVDDAKGSRNALDRSLEELAVRHIVQPVNGAEEPHWELVHDVLCEPAWRATGPSEMGLSVLRRALRRGRRWLPLREYWRAMRADLEELPDVPRKRARRLLRLTEAFTGVRILLVAFLVLVGLQFSFAHVRIEDEEPYAVRVYRGLRVLDRLPPPLAQVVLYDTGLTDQDIPPNQRNALFALRLRSWDGARDERVARLHNSVQQELSGRRLCSLGHWDVGTEILVQQRPETSLLQALDVSSEFEAQLLRLMRVSEETVRRKAISVLGQISLLDAESVATQLIPLLKDNNSSVRKAATEALGQLRANAAETLVPELILLLKDNDSEIRFAAARALGGLGASAVETALPELIPWLKVNDYGARFIAALAFGQLDTAATEKVVPELIPWLKDNNSDVRFIAVTALGQLNASAAETVLPELIPLLKDDDSDVRFAVMRAFYQLGMGAAEIIVPEMVLLLEDNDSDIRIAAARTLSQVGAGAAETAIPKMVALLRDNNSEVRSIAAHALTQLSAGEEVVPELIPLLKDDDWNVRSDAAKALGQIGIGAAETVVPELILWLKDNDSDVRKAAVQTLGQFGAGAAEAVTELIPLLKDRDVRFDAAGALGQIGVGAAETVAPELISWLKDNHSDVRRRAVQALGQLGAGTAEAVVPEMVLLLKDDESDVRRAAAQALGQFGASTAGAAVPELVPLLNDDDFDVRRSAAEAWVRLESPSSAPFFSRLLAELQSDESRLDGRYREGIVHALRFWLREGQPPTESTSAEPADDEPWTEKARGEHDALVAELERLREIERPWWLRVAAWDVLLGPYVRSQFPMRRITNESSEFWIW